MNNSIFAPHVVGHYPGPHPADHPGDQVWEVVADVKPGEVGPSLGSARPRGSLCPPAPPTVDRHFAVEVSVGS